MYTITDLATLQTFFKKEKLVSFGLGYLFTSNNSQINLSGVIGSKTGDKISFKNTQLSVNWVSFF
ncbi:MAG: hypothetical protein ACWIPI_05785 [Polaribacter sp.]